jgi:hypothetical protein
MRFRRLRPTDRPLDAVFLLLLIAVLVLVGYEFSEVGAVLAGVVVALWQGIASIRNKQDHEDT